MKNNYLLHFVTLLLCIVNISYSQVAEYNNLDKKADYKTYITKSKDTITVGSVLTIGLPYNQQQFTFITQGNQPTASFLAGNTIKITKLRALGNKTKGYKIYAYFKGYGMLPVIIDVESALLAKEIVLE